VTFPQWEFLQPNINGHQMLRADPQQLSLLGSNGQATVKKMFGQAAM
jgi:hypothetical protein